MGEVNYASARIRFPDHFHQSCHPSKTCCKSRYGIVLNFTIYIHVACNPICYNPVRQFTMHQHHYRAPYHRPDLHDQADRHPLHLDLTSAIALLAISCDPSEPRGADGSSYTA